MERHLVFWDYKTILLRCQFYQKQSIDVTQFLSKFQQPLFRNRKADIQIHTHFKELWIAKAFLKKKKKIGVLPLLNFKFYYQATTIKALW